jgi:hypothetical protein
MPPPSGQRFGGIIRQHDLQIDARPVFDDIDMFDPIGIANDAVGQREAIGEVFQIGRGRHHHGVGRAAIAESDRHFLGHSAHVARIRAISAMSMAPDLSGNCARHLPHSAATSGVIRTIMRMEAGLDSGPILHHLETPITPWDTGGSLTERLADLGATALVEALALLQRGQLPERIQDHARATHAPKINRDVAHLSWLEDAEALARRIRAFDPAPGAWTTLEGGLEVKLFGARPVPESGPPGTILAVAPNLVVAAASQAVAIEEVQPTGRRRMPVAEWIRGRGASIGQHFT